MKILLVDDDSRIRALLKQMLKDEFIVDVATNGSEAEELVYSSHYDVVILDLVLPDIDGAELCSLIKTRLKNLPVIIISGKSGVNDKDRAFDKGADDYLVKPFGSRELKARIRAVVRRGSFESYPTELGIRDLKFDINKKLATYKNTRINLRKKEMQLLEYLLLNKGRVITRTEILENVWDMNANPFTNTVDVHIKRLRDKIERRYNERYIQTIHSLGYLVE